jgi:hypothetical protein
VRILAPTHVFDRKIDQLREFDVILDRRCSTRFASTLDLEALPPHADLIIGAVLVRGAKAPHVITRAHLNRIKPGPVFADVSIDQGGCFETSRPTTHRDPTERMAAFVETDECLMGFVRRELDDPPAERCGRCANCAGPFAPTEHPAAPSAPRGAGSLRL